MVVVPENASERGGESAPVERPVLTKVKARQGVTGHNVRYVLAASLAAVVAAFVAIYIVYFA
jgi:hypothetical protein